MNRKTQSRVRFAICIVLSFLICMFSFLLLCVTIFQSTILNESFFLKHLDSTGYYSKLSEEIKQEFISYGSASGVDASHFDTVFSEIIPPTQIQQDVRNSVHQVFTGSVQPLDTASLAEQLKESFLAYAQSKGITVTDDSAVQYLVDTCMRSYSDYTTLPYAGQLSSLIGNYGRPIQFLSFGLLAVILILAVFIFVINHWKHRVVRFYIYALSGTLLMSLALPIAALLSNKIDKVSLASPALYDFAVSYLHGTVFYFFFGALCVGIFLLILYFIFSHLKHKAQAKH